MSKRLLDLFISLMALLIMMPLFVIIFLLLKLTIGTPTLFIQTRPGLHGKPFQLIKFRTMTYETDAYGRLLPDVARLTKIGCFLRASSLDELPSLFNVLKGEMSLVGPRPLLMEYLPLYSSEQSRRHEVLPGITGWAQVNGRNAISWDQKFSFDVWYVDNRSMRLDLIILGLTLYRVVRRENISAPGEATMHKFRPDVENVNE